MLAIARPFRACKEIENVLELSGHIVILERGDCMFVDKVCWIHILCNKLQFVMGLDLVFWCVFFLPLYVVRRYMWFGKKICHCQDRERLGEFGEMICYCQIHEWLGEVGPLSGP